MMKEIWEWDFDVMKVTETQLRKKMEVSSGEYKLLGKGRSKNPRKVREVGLLIRQNRGLTFKELDVGNCEASENSLAVRIKYRGESRIDNFILVVCYMTVEGRGGRTENEGKCERIGRIITENRQEQVAIMGDISGHIGILEDVNKNGRLIVVCW